MPVERSATLAQEQAISLRTEVVHRIPSLDSLRGVAILMVIFGHFIPTRIALGGAQDMVSSLGRGGVMLFFLLSGYLVFRNIEKQDSLTFMSRRLFKILPAYWVSIVLIAAFSFLFTKNSFPLDVVISNFFMVQDILHKESMSGVYWTLLIEVKFYFFLAVQHFILRDRGILLVLAALIGLNAFIWFTRGHASVLLTFFPAFYVGIEVRRAEASGWSHAALLRVAAIALTVAASLFAFDEYYTNWSVGYLLVEAAVLVLFLRVNVSNAILGFFGRVSYSHYLYHATIGYAFLTFVPASPSLLVNIGVIAAAVLLTTAIALVSFRLVEVPMVTFGKRQERLWLRARERAPL